MIRFVPLAAAVLSFASFAPATALAQSGGYYVATAAQAPKKASFVTQSITWKCQDSMCFAPRSQSRAELMCERAASRIGTLSAFSAGGKPFDAETLAACNARVK